MFELERLKVALSVQPTSSAKEKWYFCEPDNLSAVADPLDRLKLFFKRHPRFYYFLVHVVSPVWINSRVRKKFLKNSTGVVLNIGSGNEPSEANVINVDMMDYENGDIVCDIHQLPFKDDSVDAVMNIAVLEHVKEPQAVVKEIYRILKPGGRVLSVVPFVYPFHASPEDYQRYSLPGIEYLHRDFQLVESGVCSGPVSGLMCVAQEFAASILSLGVPWLYKGLTIAMMLLTWPLKFLDPLVVKLPAAKNVAATLYFVGKKP
ncbi:class I SAM-dependent methyltransferase [bacterium]|nr:class I SAM-dependent methyltransferase [bacterium]